MMPEELDADSLYLFVFGPGFGESIAVRVPPDRWLVIDSCYVAQTAAALHLLPRYGGHCECLVLTHRHQDHYPGFSKVVDFAPWTTIGCNDLALDDRFSASRDLESRLTGELEQALCAIRERWAISPQTKWRTWSGERRAVGDAELLALHPDEPFARGNAGSDSNEFSSALLLTWRGNRLLLGADVPNPHWHRIGAETGNLDSHSVMKIPHHGSNDALDDGFLVGCPERLWIVTPFNRGRKLPQFGDASGVSRMLRHVDAVYLTGLPVAHNRQMDRPCHATRQDLAAVTTPQSGIFSLPGGIEGTIEPVRQDVSCYVVARFDAFGSGEIACCGPGSVRVTEG